MSFLALYIPKFAESAVGLRLLLVAVSAAVVLFYARQRWGAFLSTVFLGGGLLAGAISLIVPALFVDLQGQGDFYREVNNSSMPDWFFVVFIDLDVGSGMLFIAAGILGGWLVLEGGGRLWSYVQQPCVRKKAV